MLAHSTEGRERSPRGKKKCRIVDARLIATKLEHGNPIIITNFSRVFSSIKSRSLTIQRSMLDSLGTEVEHASP